MTDPAIAETQPAPWGFWATMGLSALVYLAFFAVSLLVVLAVGMVHMVVSPGAGMAEAGAAAGSGFAAFLSIAFAAPMGIWLVLRCVRARQWLPADYLGLMPVRFRSLLIWPGLAVLFLMGSDLLTQALDRPYMPDVMVDYYRTSGSVVLAWAVIVLVGPVFEEVLFRGFMFRGIQSSVLGTAGAVAITAALWAVAHIQYDAYLMATIFVLGLLFGAARAVTGSLYLTIALHVANNLIATIGMHLFAG